MLKQQAQQQQLPLTFRALPVLCTAHALPVPMGFVTFTMSDAYPGARGHRQRVAAYRCPACGAIELFAQHNVTGEPLQLRRLS